MSNRPRPTRKVTIDMVAMMVLVAIVIGLVISGTAAGTSIEAPQRWTPAANNDLTGEQLYRFACAQCHGRNLEGGEGPRLGAGSDAVDHDDGEIADVVFGGEDDMPPLQGALTDEQVQAIINHLRDIQTQ